MTPPPVDLIGAAGRAEKLTPTIHINGRQRRQKKGRPDDPSAPDARTGSRMIDTDGATEPARTSP